MMRNSAKLVAAGILGGFLSLGMFKLIESHHDEINQVTNKSLQNHIGFRTNHIPVTSPVTETTMDFSYAAEKSVNSVVHVTTEYITQYRPDPIIEFFGGRQAPQSQYATGSGVIISSDGYIVTNNHVIDDANNIEITLNDQHTYKAKLIGTDPSTDLALVKIDAKNLPFATFGNSDDVRIGEWVLAVGNPFNLTSTVTAGIVSAKARNINIVKGDINNDIFPLESFIQTDAAVNPGNSGGALVSTDGKLIGINTAIASQTGSYSGYSFAIPSNLVKKVIEDLLDYGMVQRAFIGVSIQDVDQITAEELDLPNLNGVLINGVSEDGAAKEAGIKANDVILQVGEIAVNDVPELQEQIGRFRPGDVAKITLRRGSEIKTVHLTLRNKEGNTEVLKKEEVLGLMALGASFKKVSFSELSNLGLEHGVKIASIENGKLKSAGLSKGFIITSIDKEAVSTPEEVVDYLKTKKGGVLIEGYYPNGMKGYIGFGL